MSDLKQIVQRIERRLAAVDMNATEASRKAGLSGSAIYNLQRGAAGKIKTKGANANTLKKLAPVLKTTFAWLADNEGPESLDAEIGLTMAPAIRVPLISWVTAGSLASSEGQLDLADARKVNVPELDPKGDWIALEVDGDSMNRISPPQSVILVNRRETRLVPNGCYVIANDAGDASYKRYRPSPPLWHPVSTNKKHKPLTAKEAQEIRVIGRVRKTMLDM